MKLFWIALISVFSVPAFATVDSVRFECVSQTNGGRIVSINGCMSAQGDEIVTCPHDFYEFITVVRETAVAKQTPDMIETARIPGRLFSVRWMGASFGLDLKDPIAGEMSLFYTSDRSTSAAPFWQLNLPAFDHQFRAVGCKFQENSSGH